MARFYCPQPLALGMIITLDPGIVRHIQVLRLQPGAQLTLFNGQGGAYVAILVAVDRKSAQAEIKTFSAEEVELPYALTLAQALPEAAKMDWIIEKAVELGVSAIQPLAAQRCVVRLSEQRAERRHQHWQGIIQAACEQCGRNRLPHLGQPGRFEDWIAQRPLHPRILLSPRATASLSEWARHHPPQPLTLLVGPEGGFTDAEENAALAHGAMAFSMGPRILRTETAGMAALAAINAIWGEM